MLTVPQNLPSRLRLVRERIDVAARAAGRSAGEITLIGVSKTQSAAAVREALAAGLTDFGENYVQEALDKIEAIGPGAATWHFIGALQSNKTRPVAETFDWVHTVDRARIARRLSEQRPWHAPPLRVCLQVNLGDEPTKSGIAPDGLRKLAAEVTALPRIELRGLMSIPPEESDPGRQRHWFRRLRELRDDLRHAGHALDVLSMGMSGDFEVAIAEGATHLRVGTAIFGRRD